PELLIVGSPVVALADSGEELVSAERQPPHHVDLINEDHDGPGTAREHDPLQPRHDSLEGTDFRVLGPEGPQLLPQVELFPAAMPLLGGKILTEGLQVEDGNPCPIAAEALGCAEGKRRLAHLASGEKVAVFTAGEGVVQLGVGASLDVGESIDRESAARNVVA